MASASRSKACEAIALRSWHLPRSARKTRADGQLPFQFRYFQNLEQDVVLPAGFEPRAVNVEVRSARQAPVRESYPWQVQAEG